MSGVHRIRRMIDILFLDGFRAAPSRMAFVSLLLVVGGGASTCYPLGYRVLLDGALHGSLGDVVWGVVIVGGLLSVGWLLSSIGSAESMTLADHIALYRTGETVKLISGVSTLEHLERPDYLNQVERLNANRRQLAGAPRTVLRNASTVARIAALLALLGSVSPWLLFLPVCALPPLAADRICRRIILRSDQTMAHHRRLATMIFALTTEPASAGEMRSYGLAEHLAAEHARCRDDLNRRSATEARQVLLIESAGWILYAAALMAAIAFVVVRATEGAYSAGTVLMTVSLIRRSRTQLASAAEGSGNIVSTMATTERLLWLEQHASDQQAAAGSDEPPPTLQHGIEIRGLTFRYPDTGNIVLDDINVTLPAGATVALVGENGSGKTTLVKLLLGMYPPETGQILVDGTPLPELSPQRWRARCTAVFQDFSRFQLLALESIGIADLSSLNDQPAALAALERAGASDLTAQLPSGLVTYVGTSYTDAHGLSGGQWQKLALARGLRREDPLLELLDEPTSSLDAQAEHALFERYAAAASSTRTRTGGITVLVSHRFSTVLMADLIVLIERGRVKEMGSHDQLLARAGRYAELFELQARNYR